MSLLRQSSLNQLKRINNEIKKQGGKTDKTSKSEKGISNSICIDNPINSDISGKRKIITYDQMFSIDIPDANKKVTIKNEMKLNEGKVKKTLQNAIENWFNGDKKSIKIISKITKININEISNILKKSNENDAMKNLMNYNPKNEKLFSKNILSFEKMFENGPNDSPQEIMKNMKTIKNWHSINTPKKEINQLLVGKYIDNGKVKGYINRIEGNFVFIDSIIEPLGIIKIKLKDAIKGHKTKKEKSELNINIEGPNNKSLGNAPKIGIDYSPKINSKSKIATDQKISNKINIEKNIKKFSDMSIDFDNKILTTKKNSIAPIINKKGIEAKDTKNIKNEIYKNKIIKLNDFFKPKN
jgi:hypothetical protein